MSVVLDTHSAIWYLNESRELSAAAGRAINKSLRGGRPVYISAISLVEAFFLVERGRLPLEALWRLEQGLADATSGIVLQAVDEEIARAVPHVPRTAVPEMPDRIIAATAVRLGAPLVTRDARMANSGIQTIW